MMVAQEVSDYCTAQLVGKDGNPVTGKKIFITSPSIPISKLLMALKCTFQISCQISLDEIFSKKFDCC
jgi:hypothetical protein